MFEYLLISFILVLMVIFPKPVAKMQGFMMMKINQLVGDRLGRKEFFDESTRDFFNSAIYIRGVCLFFFIIMTIDFILHGKM